MHPEALCIRMRPVICCCYWFGWLVGWKSFVDERLGRAGKSSIRNVRSREDGCCKGGIKFHDFPLWPHVMLPFRLFTCSMGCLPQASARP